MENRKKLNCILLIDDNKADNNYHQIIIKGMNIADNIQIAKDGLEALEYLKTENQIPPDLIFLDINMPKMDGWEFLDAYKNLDPKQKAQIIIVILTTSGNPDDKKRAESISEVAGFTVKPLTEEMLTEILEQHFSV